MLPALSRALVLLLALAPAAAKAQQLDKVTQQTNDTVGQLDEVEGYINETMALAAEKYDAEFVDVVAGDAQ